MRKEMQWGLLAFVILLISIQASAGATPNKFERLWKQKGVADYLLKGKIVTFGATKYFETRVKANSVVAYEVNGVPSPMEKAITVDLLFSIVTRPLGKNETVEVRRYDKEYGIPEWVGQGRRDVTDTGGYIEITRFIPNPETYRPPDLTCQESYAVEDFDGLRLLLRREDRLFVQSLSDRKLVLVTTGLVPGGRARLAWPYVLWSNLLRKNYFISAKNLESGQTRALTDESRDDTFSFLSEGRWVAWRNSSNREYTLNLLDLGTGSNTVVSKISFIGMDRNALLRNGQLIWIDDEEVKVFRPGQESKKIALGGLTPLELLGFEGDDLYFLVEGEEKTGGVRNKVIARHSLSSGSVQAVNAMLHSPSTIAVATGFVAWIDKRDGADEVFALPLTGGAERQISRGFGHRTLLAVKGTRAIWDDYRYGIRALHCYDWETEKDETLWTCGIAEPARSERAKPSSPGDSRSLFEKGSR